MRDEITHRDGGILLTARMPWPYRVFLPIGYLLMSALCPLIWRSAQNLGWLFFGYCAVYVLAGIGVLEVLFKRTDFTDVGVLQRSTFGRVHFIPYNRIARLRIEEERVVIETSHGKKVNVYLREADPEAIAGLLNKQTGGTVVISGST